MRENLQQGFRRYVWQETGIYRHFRETVWLPFSSTKRSSKRSSVLFFFFLVFLFGAFVVTRLLDSTTVTSIAGNAPPKTILTTTTTHVSPSEILKSPPPKIQIPLNCTSGSLTRFCPPNYYPSNFHSPDDQDRPPPAACPDYFRWIHEDLRPWKETGVTREMVERAKRTANFRLVVVDGKAYVERYRRAFQTRDVFTQWGILQLLRRYPGKIPDLDLMFDCVDWPVVKLVDYSGPNAMAPPPLFRYCGDDSTLDIVFPDWSFWGWAEINIKPWEGLLEELKEGNKKKRWMDREAYAYWKGNPIVAATRMDLLKCNVSDKQDWGARVFAQVSRRPYDLQKKNESSCLGLTSCLDILFSLILEGKLHIRNSICLLKSVL
ncbi:hypothetical protein Vadar_015695 [Vaccinium darrowii]|nr:hypothetical protein Vadar_015695 [Vaccinium darrowii]